MTVGKWAFLGYIGSIVAANVLITVFGIIPIGFGLMAPAGVFAVGVTFTLRDILQDSMGRRYVNMAILAGAVLSALLNPALGIASGMAFLLSEIADLYVYTPIRGRSWIAAIVASNTIGAIVDSAIFLMLAFGSLEYLPGQVIGKLWMTGIAVAVILAYRMIARGRVLA